MLLETVKRKKNQIEQIRDEVGSEIERVRREFRPIQEQFRDAENKESQIETRNAMEKIDEMITMVLPNPIRHDRKRTYVDIDNGSYITLGGARNIGLLYKNRDGERINSKYLSREKLVKIFTTPIWKNLLEFVPKGEKRETFKKIGKALSKDIDTSVLHSKFVKKVVVDTDRKEVKQLLKYINALRENEEAYPNELELYITRNGIRLVAPKGTFYDELGLTSYEKELADLNFKDCLVVEALQDEIGELVNKYSKWVTQKSKKFADTIDTVYENMSAEFPEIAAQML